MKIFLDTNVIVAASIRQHPHFARADKLLRRCVERKDEAVIHAHSVLEFHSAVTQLPRGLAVPPAAVETLLKDGILPFVRCVALPAREVLQLQKQAGQLGLTGGIIYDLYHLAVAQKEQVERLYTFNTGHFQQIAPPEFIGRIVAP